MRKKRVWRFYCDHCSKGGCSGGHIAKHEKGCTRNPNRECGMCRETGLDQSPTSELLEALTSGGIAKVRELADGCPACIMAAIHALRKIEPLETSEDYTDSNFIDFDYRTAADEFWREFGNKQREEASYR